MKRLIQDSFVILGGIVVTSSVAILTNAITGSGLATIIAIVTFSVFGGYTMYLHRLHTK